MRRRTKILLVSGETIAFAVLGGLLYYRDDPLTSVPFDAARWSTASDKLRFRMAIDIRGRALLIGKSQAEVLTLLGEPDVREGGPLAQKFTYRMPRAAVHGELIVSMYTSSGVYDVQLVFAGAS